MRAICRRLHFGSSAARGARHGPPKLRLKFEVTRQASSPRLCASVRAVPWADEAEQELSRLAFSACKLSAEVRILGAGLPEELDTDPQSYIGSLRWQDKQAPPVSVPLCEQCHGQMRLSNSYPMLALSACDLSADVRILGAGLLETPSTDPQSYVGSLRCQDKQAAPVSVPLCQQCHGQIRLSNSFPG